MNAHQLDADGVIKNTIVVDSLDVLPNLVDASIGGKIGDSIVNGVLFPVEVPRVVPSVVTMRQARIALLEAGLIGNVTTAIAALPEPEKTESSIYWEYSTEIQRSHPHTLMLATMMGLDESELDELFIKAGAL